MLKISPLLIAFKIGLVSNTKAKETLLCHFFKGWPEAKFK
jgi:hypothetical protein